MKKMMKLEMTTSRKLLQVLDQAPKPLLILVQEAILPMAPVRPMMLEPLGQLRKTAILESTTPHLDQQTLLGLVVAQVLMWPERCLPMWQTGIKRLEPQDQQALILELSQLPLQLRSDLTILQVVTDLMTNLWEVQMLQLLSNQLLLKTHQSPNLSLYPEEALQKMTTRQLFTSALSLPLLSPHLSSVCPLHHTDWCGRLLYCCHQGGFH
ncbi:hypothetical protein DSO57_1028248 [Entomophthora muscae]|uniref:Uncharacterized protein n=1 Tax=Entomophthora muscae TaxID=34485 RepID=A0ACC2UB82_9FUNG|nr:hypothetical protein DSO57_1028248 [Entomophthora muscae]